MLTLQNVTHVYANGTRALDDATLTTVEAKKLYADSKGLETEAALAEDFEVGAFSAQPGKDGFSAQRILQVERRPLTSGAQQSTFPLPSEPKWVGVDPYNKRIDRNSDDNLVSVDGS